MFNKYLLFCLFAWSMISIVMLFKSHVTWTKFVAYWAIVAPRFYMLGFHMVIHSCFVSGIVSCHGHILPVWTLFSLHSHSHWIWIELSGFVCCRIFCRGPGADVCITAGSHQVETELHEDVTPEFLRRLRALPPLLQGWQGCQTHQEGGGNVAAGPSG